MFLTKNKKGVIMTNQANSAGSDLDFTVIGFNQFLVKVNSKVSLENWIKPKIEEIVENVNDSLRNVPDEPRD